MVDWQDIRRRNEAFKLSGYRALGGLVRYVGGAGPDIDPAQCHYHDVAPVPDEASDVAALEADVVSRALAALSWLR